MISYKTQDVFKILLFTIATALVIVWCIRRASKTKQLATVTFIRTDDESCQDITSNKDTFMRHVRTDR